MHRYLCLDLLEFLAFPLFYVLIWFRGVIYLSQLLEPSL